MSGFIDRNFEVIGIPVNLSQARELFSQMLENTKEYLPGWDLKGND